MSVVFMGSSWTNFAPERKESEQCLSDSPVALLRKVAVNGKQTLEGCVARFASFIGTADAMGRSAEGVKFSNFITWKENPAAA